MLGNDIVDYQIDEKKYLNQRFINRVLSKTERHYLAKSSQPNAFLWSLWAAKEASFKAYQKTALQSIFSPSQFQAEEKLLRTLLGHDFKQPIQASLKHQNQTIHLFYSWPNQTTVHCVAFIGPHFLADKIQVSITQDWDKQIVNKQSSQVRAVANKLLQQNNLSAHIERPLITMPGYSKPGPPVLISPDNKTLPDQISLSHDGSWLAAVLLCK